MKRSMVLWLGVAAAVAVSGTANAALIININTDGSFTAAQLAVINQAKADWLAKLGFNGGNQTIRLNFSTDNTIGDGETSGWVTDANGRVTAANIKINTAGHNWTLGAPAAGMEDALDTVRHEMCHALGFTVALANFAAKVKLDGTNRYFDLDRNGSFNAVNDFDLIDDPDQGTHAPASSGDLMAPTTPAGVRNEITFKHAAVLAQAFGYRVLPGPSALAVFAGFALIGRRRRAAA